MAYVARRRTTAYSTFGNVAYAPAYDGSAVRAPSRTPEYEPRPQVRTRERTVSRPKVQVREAGVVSPMAVIGFMASALFAALVLVSYVQLTELADQAVSLRSSLSQMQTEHVMLTAQYEKIFDEDSLQAAVGNYMSRPNADQYVYVDLSEGDSVTLYQQKDTKSGVSGAAESVKEILRNILAYF